MSVRSKQGMARYNPGMARYNPGWEDPTLFPNIAEWSVECVITGGCLYLTWLLGHQRII